MFRAIQNVAPFNFYFETFFCCTDDIITDAETIKMTYIYKVDLPGMTL